MDAARFVALCGGQDPRRSGRVDARGPDPGVARAADPADLDLVVVHRDPDLWIVDKPAGLAVQGGSAVDDHVVARLDRAFGRRAGTTFRPAPAHRLDRGTSGLLVCGVTGRGLRGAAELFRAGTVEKTYLAVVTGRPDPAEGTIDLPLVDRPNHARGPRARPDPAGLPAITHYRTVAAGARTSELEVVIETGRTHQIRAHLAAIGHPIVGDVRYGAPKDGPLPRGTFALHAHRLRFRHPVTGDGLNVEAPRPGRFDPLVEAGG